MSGTSVIMYKTNKRLYRNVILIFIKVSIIWIFLHPKLKIKNRSSAITRRLPVVKRERERERERKY